MTPAKKPPRRPHAWKPGEVPCYRCTAVPAEVGAVCRPCWDVLRRELAPPRPRPPGDSLHG